MSKTLFIILTSLIFYYKGKDSGKEQKIFDRIEFVYNLKQTVDEKTWRTFNNKEYDVPLIYLTDTRRPDYQLLKSDTSFKSFEKFRNYDLEKDKWLYLTGNTTYFYATGFMARLLDKLKIEYKSRLFKQGQITLEDILNEKRNNSR